MSVSTTTFVTRRRWRVAHAGAALGLALTALASHAASAPVSGSDSALVQRGAYLAKAADCVACHTTNPSQPFAGGLAFATPFGNLYSSNITPDQQHGIGRMTDAQLIAAIRDGVGQHGKLYPAMPYTSYTGMTDADVQALVAYLRTIKPVAFDPPANTMPFPFNQRWAMTFWNLFNFTSGRYQNNPAKSVEWNRGAYLVTALEHCQECHTPRNFMQGLSTSKQLGGSALGAWQAYNITSSKNSGIGGWSDAELAQYLKSGVAEHKANAAGPMAEVIQNSSRFLTDPDIKAMIVYLRDVPAINDQADSKPRYAWGQQYNDIDQVRATAAPFADANGKLNGAALYNANCATCHTYTGKGIGHYPRLLQNSAVGAPGGQNLVSVILGGVHRVNNDGEAFMPPFRASLDDAQVAAIANFMTTQFGNPAVVVTAEQVKKSR